MRSAIARFFTNPETGRVVLAQPPNLPLAVFLAATGVRLLVAPDGTTGTVVTVIGTAALLVWAGLEIARGDSPFRRVLGAAVFVITAVGIVTR
jgi:hypothetical protein